MLLVRNLGYDFIVNQESQSPKTENIREKHNNKWHNTQFETWNGLIVFSPFCNTLQSDVYLHVQYEYE